VIHRRHVLLIVTILFALTSQPLQAGYLFKNGKLIDEKFIASLPLEEHYALGIKALKAKNWQEAALQFRIVTINFPQAARSREAYYFLGVCLYHEGDEDTANDNFNKYLRVESSPKYFEETFQYKLAIANAFKNGARKHLFGFEKMPRVFQSRTHALEIYDEIIGALPNHELAAKALMGKAQVLLQKERYRECIEAYQTVIRKFPKTEYAAKSYSSISEVFLKQSNCELQNPDILALAQINAKKFAQDFPRDENVQQSQDKISEMKELLAQELYETGRLYERKKEPGASVLYYQAAIDEYPNTKVAQKCQERLQSLQKYIPKTDETHVQ